MPKIEEVADNIYRLETPIPGTPTVFAVYFIKESEGVLIEPGPAAAVPSILEGMGQIRMKDLAYIIPTHIHVDHAGGTGSLAQIFSRARVLVHPAGQKHFIDPSKLIESTKAVFGPECEGVFGPTLPVPESQITVPEDGEVISVNGRELQIVYTPGHAPHCISIFDKKVKGIFCGEALGMPGEGEELFPLPAVAPPSFDQELYLETMEKLKELDARILFYSHGGVGREPDKLISMASENTSAVGELILDALKKGKSADKISGQVGGYVSDKFGIQLSEFDLLMTVGGYTLYFTKKGLV
jgi:glyoxylase-like metal-dependent hydrolase (beta-lactamase superfamily II)